MVVTTIKATCGCGVVVSGPPEKVIEEATKHCQDKKHIMTVAGTVKPDMFNPLPTEESKPFQIWDSNLWKCPKCGLEIITGFGSGPLAEHYQEDGALLKRAIESYEKHPQLVKNFQ